VAETETKLILITEGPRVSQRSSAIPRHLASPTTFEADAEPRADCPADLLCPLDCRIDLARAFRLPVAPHAGEMS
jgi:hypothetical protein